MLGAPVLNALRPVVRSLRRELDCIAVSNSFMLSAYQKVANDGDDRQRRLLYGRSHRSLEGRRARFAKNAWAVRDGEVGYDLPLRDENAGLDWARAVSALGHDVEIKQLYRFLVKEVEPGLFVDIGANFGQHSHYFLAAGWRVQSFEPNPNCTAYHKAVCGLNGWGLDHWHEVALSDTLGIATLTFPEGREWLGRVGDLPLDRNNNRSVNVPLVTLASIMSTIEDAVIKIDVEGHEKKVLRGFPGGLDRVRCLIFEALSAPELDQICSILRDARLEIFALAADGTRSSEGATERGLTNFAAVPRGDQVYNWLRSRI